MKFSFIIIKYINSYLIIHLFYWINHSWSFYQSFNTDNSFPFVYKYSWQIVVVHMPLAIIVPSWVSKVILFGSSNIVKFVIISFPKVIPIFKSFAKIIDESAIITWCVVTVRLLVFVYIWINVSFPGIYYIAVTVVHLYWLLSCLVSTISPILSFSI